MGSSSSKKLEISNVPSDVIHKKEKNKRAVKNLPKSIIITNAPPQTGVPDATVNAVQEEKNIEENTEVSNAAAKVASGRMPVDLYYLAPSAPCRAVMMTGRAVGVDFNLKICNIMEGDSMKPEYLKMNPQHTIPTMNDNGLIIWESRPIMAYLVNQYAKDDSLYPKDPKKRVLVDQRLYFDMGTLYQRQAEYYYPVIFRGAALDPEKLKALKEAMEWFNTMLEGTTFAAGDHLTVADISLAVTVSNMEGFEFDLSPYPNVVEWFARTKEALVPYGYEEINQAGANMISGFYKNAGAQ